MTNADRDIEVLKISFEPVETKPCDSCLRPSEAPRTRQGDTICDNCRAMFVFAKVLLKNGIADEAEITATLAYAAHRGTRALIHWKDIAGKDGMYGRFDITRVVKGVPILRPKPAVAEIVRYPEHFGVADRTVARETAAPRGRRCRAANTGASAQAYSPTA